jgi:hypothetical protein
MTRALVIAGAFVLSGVLAVGLGCDRAGSSIVATLVVNPTGSCGTIPDPGRIGPSSDGTDVLVPDCQNPLRRNYWRVRTLDGRHAWTVPRMDGDPRLQPICADANDPLHPLVERYDLCAPADSEGKVEIVNNMDLADALRLTHFLEGQLRFVAVPVPIVPMSLSPAPPGSTTIQPFPDWDEVVEACALHPNSADLETICENLRKNLDVVNEGILCLPDFFAGPTAVELAARMNELYGIAVN